MQEEVKGGWVIDLVYRKRLNKLQRRAGEVLCREGVAIASVAIFGIPSMPCGVPFLVEK